MVDMGKFGKANLRALFLKLHKLKWTRAIFSFGSMHFMRLALPLLAFPWLGRVLGAEAFGLLMYMCLFPHLSALCVEWGFPLGAARSAAALRDKPGELGDLLRSVSLAKGLLTILCLFFFFLLSPFIPHASNYPGAYLLALCAGFARAASPFWFYQGTNRALLQLVCWDIGSSLAILICTLLFIHEPAQWPLYLLFYVAFKGIAGLWLTLNLLKKHRGKWQAAEAWRLVRESKSLFTGLVFADLYHYVTQIICGFFLDAAAMGALVALSKIIRALSSLALPFTQAIFPEICLLGKTAPAKSRKILRISLSGTFAAMLAACAFAWLTAPWLLRLALGQAFVHNADILRILLLSSPLAALNMVLAHQTLVAYGHDKAQAFASGLMAILSLPAAWLLSDKGGLYGAALVPLCAESFLLLALAATIFYLCPQALFNVNNPEKRP